MKPAARRFRPPHRPRVLVLGAGAAGLAAAYRLDQAGAQVTVLDKNPYAGGRMSTETADGFRIDTGAGFFTQFYTHTLDLIRELGLESACVPVDGRPGLFFDGRMHPIRNGAAGLWSLPLPVWSTLRIVRPAVDVLRHRRALDPHALHKALALDDRSALEYTLETLDARWLEMLVRPALAGILYWTPEHTSRAMLLILLKAWRGMRRFTLHRGVGQLADALANRLDVRLRTEVERVEPGGTQTYRVTARPPHGPQLFEADGVVCATEAVHVPTLIADLTPGQRAFFTSMPYASTVVGAMGIEGRAWPGVQSVLLPRPTGPPGVLGAATSTAAKNPAQTPPGHDLMMLFAAPGPADTLLTEDDARIHRDMLDDLDASGLLPNARRRETAFHLYRWRYALPHFDVGSFERLRVFERGDIESGRLVFAGDYLGGPFVEGAVTSGLRAADRLIARL